MRRTSLALAGVLAITGFLLVTAASSARASKRAEAPRKTELINLVVDRQSQVNDLDQAVKDLQQQVGAAQQRESRRNKQSAADAARLARLSLQAGTTAVSGRGIEVRLSDSQRQPPNGQDAGAYRIHDSDLQLMINALFAAHAEAVAVNGSRIVVTTPVRSAGDTIVVNFRPVTPPYVIVAIGADTNDFEASDIASRFRHWTSLFGLGYSVHSVGTVTVPAFAGRVAMSDAGPAAGP